MSNKVKVIIAGSREFPIPFNLELASHLIEDTLSCLDIGLDKVEVVSGTARGADQMGESWAESREIPVKKFPAEWRKYGNSAGHIRNGAMAAYGDVLIAFWDGTSKGTEGMIRLAKKKGMKVIVFKAIVGSEISFDNEVFSQSYRWESEWTNCGEVLDS